MDKAHLTDLIEKGLTLRDIAKCEKQSLGGVRYWLKKHGLRTRRGPHGVVPKDMVLPRQCPCGEADPQQFYGNKRRTCATCHNRYTLLNGQDKRRKALEHLGGRCKACGFDRWLSALAIHHLDPSEKDPDFGGLRSWAWDRIEVELAKCILLCHNCHAAFHSGEDIWV